MTALNFSEENKIVIQAPVLTQHDKTGNEMFSSLSEAQRNKGEVEVAFLTEDYEYSPSPSEAQLQALQYILDHQAGLIEAFFDYTKRVLYPTYIEFIGFDEIDFPEINEPNELRKSLGITEIYIWPNAKNEMAYVAYSFDFTGDFEHGVILIAHQDQILGWEEDLVNDKVLADLA